MAAEIVEMGVRKHKSLAGGFTLVELLVVLGIIAVLAALLSPVLSKGKSKAQQTSCLNNLKQINLAVRMYADDFKDKVAAPPGFFTAVEQWYRYKELVASYVGRSASAKASDKLFSCPADIFRGTC